MAGLTAHGGTFSFQGFSAAIVGVSVETPEAEVVDMTGMSDSASASILVPTGAWKGGGMTVEYIRTPNTADPQSLVRSVGVVSFQSSGLSVSRQAILQSASTEATTGDLVRGNLRFVFTDYQGT